MSKSPRRAFLDKRSYAKQNRANNLQNYNLKRKLEVSSPSMPHLESAFPCDSPQSYPSSSDDNSSNSDIDGLSSDDGPSGGDDHDGGDVSQSSATSLPIQAFESFDNQDIDQDQRNRSKLRRQLSKAEVKLKKKKDLREKMREKRRIEREQQRNQTQISSELQQSEQPQLSLIPTLQNVPELHSPSTSFSDNSFSAHDEDIIMTQCLNQSSNTKRIRRGQKSLSELQADEEFVQLGFFDPTSSLPYFFVSIE